MCGAVEDNQRSDRKTSTAPIPSRATVRDHGTSSSAVKPSRVKFQTLKRNAASVAAAKIKDIGVNEERDEF